MAPAGRRQPAERDQRGFAGIEPHVSSTQTDPAGASGPVYLALNVPPPSTAANGVNQLERKGVAGAFDLARF